MNITPDKIIALALKYWNGSHLTDNNGKDVLTGRYIKRTTTQPKTTRYIKCHNWQGDDYLVRI
jgi:hypothetical protein